MTVALATRKLVEAKTEEDDKFLERELKRQKEGKDGSSRLNSMRKGTMVKNNTG
jgi:hypothetical protein